MKMTASRVLFFVATVLFVIAALIAGNVVFKGSNYVPFALGGFAAVALAWALA
jgi:hypothetical protein